ncbi:MAG: DNA methyltransferase [Thermodesulfovibrio sp.]|uniref:DNA methyltransferase n=1 Tax=Thermodesulfovibrio sp. N1 TaxID=1871110 RepID=UPI0008578A60|nr:DNA methyltransferase [Thermodesulfovibrio sp. N1]MDI6713928.1 DNA methyltransferase [Thermodesulfovibrio sp.]ODA43539.1 DNA methylase N-4/N-6 domain protein [Thermodesulfovibrio sp. N1]
MKGFIFACTDKTEKECFERMIFSTNKLYSDEVLQIKKGDYLFLYNIDKDVLYGIFKAVSDGGKNIEPHAWGGKYPYQVKVEKNENLIILKEAKKILDKMGIKWGKVINSQLLDIFLDYLQNLDNFDWSKIKQIIDDNEKPKLETTTLWDYPTQSYGKMPKGNNKYPGVTPAFVIYNMIKRYTEVGDLVVDPMAGSGTTLDVCKEENRKCICYDISPTRPDIVQNDARNIPLPDNSVDMIFIDSPYGDNVRYNDHPEDIGKISAETEHFYDELEKVMRECHRILKPGKVLGWLIGDQWVKKKFTPVGFRIFERLCKYFEPVDIICVARRNQTSNTAIWHNRALRFNFYLRGFKYLFIVRKFSQETLKREKRQIKWNQYKRDKKNE